MATIPTGHGSRYRKLKDRALAALLTQPTVEAAAKQVGLGSTTLYRWLREIPEFKKEYRVFQAQVVEQGVATLTRAFNEAAEALLTIIRDKDISAGVRVSAIRLLMEQSINGIELNNIMERLEAVERAQRHYEASCQY